MIVLEENGQLHFGKTGADLCKSMGQTHFAKSIIMTDEDGQIVGMQGGTMNMAKSMPLIKALRDEEILKKAQAAAPGLRRSVQSRPLKKSFAPAKRGTFDDLIEEINEMQRVQRRMFG